jgi:hypothetical protein
MCSAFVNRGRRHGGCSYVKEKRLEGVLQWIVIALTAVADRADG